jgi:branched-chain amino acid transport system permease protein
VEISVTPTYNLAIIGIGLIIVVWHGSYFLEPGGRIARSALDRDARSMGVNVPLTMTLVFGVATALECR